MEGRVTDRTAIASSLQSLIASTEAGLATGLVTFAAISAPAGVAARFSVKLRATTDDVFAEAGLYLDVGVVALSGASRFLVKADQFFIETAAGSLIYQDGVLTSPDGKLSIDLVGGSLTIDDGV